LTEDCGTIVLTLKPSLTGVCEKNEISDDASSKATGMIKSSKPNEQVNSAITDGVSKHLEADNYDADKMCPRTSISFQIT
jgi:hypothetical protein